MALTLTNLGVTWTTTAGNKTVTATPAVNDLIIIIAPSTGVATSAVTDNQSGTYTQIGSTQTGFSTTGSMNMWVRNAAISSATSTIFTATQTSSTGGGLIVLAVRGSVLFGTSAIRSTAGQSNGTTGTTPAPVLNNTPISTNLIITAVANGANSSTIAVPRTGYTEIIDQGYATPNAGFEVAYLASGETSATLTYGGTVTSVWASLGIEVIAPVTVTKTQTGTARIQRSVTKTQTGRAAIQGVATKTQGAISRISKTLTKTQGAVARVSQNYTKTQTAVARIQQIKTLTQPAVGRIATVRTKTQPAASRIAINGELTQTAVAYVDVIDNDRYWVGGSGDLNDTAHWSNTSGGSGGFSVPDNTKNIHFDVNSFSGSGQTVTNLISSVSFANLTMSDLPTSTTFSLVFGLYIYGDVELHANAVFVNDGSAIRFMDNTANHTLDTKGINMPVDFRIYDTATITLLSDLSVVPVGAEFTQLWVRSGTLDANGFDITTKKLLVDGGLLGGSGTITALDGADIYGGFVPETSTLVFNASSTDGNYGVDSAHNLVINGAVGKRVYLYAETSGTITVDSLTVMPDADIELYSNVTATTISMTGTLGHAIKWWSSNTTPRDISMASGTLNAHYVDLKYSNATGGATFNDIDGVDSGGNTGWNITTSTITKTQTATARLSRTVFLYQAGVARVSNNKASTQTGVARIATTVIKTQGAAAKIAGAVSKTQTAVGRIATNKTKTQPSVARIAIIGTKTQGAVASIGNTFTKTQSATARISKVITKNTTATSRISVDFAKTQTGVADIASTVARNQFATATVNQSFVATATQSATSRIQRRLTKTQTAVGRIGIGKTKTQTARAALTGIYPVTYGATGATAVASTGSVAIPYPASVTAGQLLCMVIMSKNSSLQFGTVSGWDKYLTSNAASSTDGVDAGGVRITVFLREATGSESGTVSVALNASMNVAFGFMMSFNKPSGTTWSTLMMSISSDSVASTLWSTSHTPWASGLQSGQLAVTVAGINTDAFTYSGFTLFASGLTFGSYNSLLSASTSVGNDLAIEAGYRLITSGTTTSTVTLNATASGNTADAPKGGTLFFVPVAVAPINKTQVATAYVAQNSTKTQSATAKIVRQGTRSGLATLSISGSAAYSSVSKLNAAPKKALYKVYDEAGVYVDTWRDVMNPEPSYSWEMNEIGSAMQVELARNAYSVGQVNYPLETEAGVTITAEDGEPIMVSTESTNQIGAGSSVQHNYRVEVWVYYGYVIREVSALGVVTTTTFGHPNGKRIYRGFIADINTRYGSTETTVLQLVSYGFDLSQEKIKLGTGETTVPYLSVDPTDLVKDAMDKFDALPRTDTLTHRTATSIATTGTVVSYTFKSNTYEEVLKKALELMPSNWGFKVGLGDDVVSYFARPSTAQHTFVMGQHIYELDVHSNILTSTNAVSFTGGGTPALYKEYIATPAANTRRVLEIKQDSRVELETSADILSEGTIEEKNAVQYRSTIEILDADYDIESIEVGDMVTFSNVGNYVDGLLLQVAALTYKFHSVVLQLDSMPRSINKRLEDIKRQLAQSDNQDIPATPLT